MKTIECDTDTLMFEVSFHNNKGSFDVFVWSLSIVLSQLFLLLFIFIIIAYKNRRRFRILTGSNVRCFSIALYFLFKRPSRSYYISTMWLRLIHCQLAEWNLLYFGVEEDDFFYVFLKRRLGVAWWSPFFGKIRRRMKFRLMGPNLVRKMKLTSTFGSRDYHGKPLTKSSDLAWYLNFLMLLASGSLSLYGGIVDLFNRI